MRKIKIQDLKDFCKAALVKEGLREDYAKICGEVLAETDALGTNSHGTKNLYGYIKKIRVGGIDIHAEPQIVKEGPGFAVMNAEKCIGMVPSVKAMEVACEKAKKTGLGLVTVKNSCHFGAAGYYANIAAHKGMIGLSMSNVDPNMTVPGAKGMLIGNNPFAYAAPANTTPTVFLDVAMSNVASLKVVQAKKDRKSIPDTWIVDKDGLPTADPSNYPDEGAMQPFARHKGYGFAVMVELLTGILSGGCTSMGGDIVSWCFEPEKPNNVCHAFMAVDAEQFLGEGVLAGRMEEMSRELRQAPKAKGSERIYTPGEIEWEKYKVAYEEGFTIPEDVLISLQELSADVKIPLKTY
ncbi:Ldh family oxidoreductase [Muricomes intestini]|jgi:LDH2 family malate/lactate/ureidoglycolate dehydrogenase|uniref:Ldh family oxidoreductase n=1 Tax=Muricomes intestini TaxID=1796634 RepID=UPI000E82654F|nr:malate dehydrogenase [Lachnospiraceae bacterium]HCR84598.1 malate dehydrogenase [Lachnospiraceae bacterium]